MDKSYDTFLWFIFPHDSLIHFCRSAWCINKPILILHINNNGLACPRNCMRQSLHWENRFLWNKHSCAIQQITYNICGLLQIIFTITGEANNFALKIKLSNNFNDRLRKVLWVCTFCAGHAKVVVPFFKFREMMYGYWKISLFLTDIHRSNLRTPYGQLLSTFITSE